MKKLNIAFIWHFHQPNYQKEYNGDFLLPWVRLHASKDYLDMLHRIDDFKNLKLNFNFSPVLLGALQKYLDGAKDLHLKLLLKPEEELDESDKIFILNNYFDLNYKNMVLKRPYFTKLYNKRANAKEINPEMFTNSQYCDIMANYTICWIDETHKKDYPELEKLFKQEKKYTLKDREKIYNIQLDIIKRILLDYKKYQDENKIEVSISPYYHPIVPLLVDFKGKEIKNFDNLPKNFSFLSDANEQISLAVEKYREIFNKNPRGMWFSEQCVCLKSAELLAKQGILWSVSDEGILAKSRKNEFIRDFEGNLENPYNLTINYRTKGKKSLNLLFADSFFANLINFGYGNYDSKAAANDLYEKIKTLQFKLQNSPRDNHILTIAMDGENCWESYQNDGDEFLSALYELIDADESLNTVLVDDFIKENKSEILENLKPGSWINRNFDLWIGEPTKNLAWSYLASVFEDLEEHKKRKLKKIKNKNDKIIFEQKCALARRELLVCEGSDWYWWYGEPNESRSDGIFDFLFRRHLANVYEILELEIPQYLKNPLTDNAAKPLRNPKQEISPSLVCDIHDKLKEWENAGQIFIPDGPTSNVSRVIKNIYFGYDKKNLYLRFELNRNSRKISCSTVENQIAIYFINHDNNYYSPIRFVNKNDNFCPIVKNQFSRELRFVFDLKNTSRIFFNKAYANGLWIQGISKNSKIVYNNVIELKIPFDDLGFKEKEFSFCVIDSTNELINEIYPQDDLIDIRVD